MNTTRDEAIRNIAVRAGNSVNIGWEELLPVIPTLLDLFAGCVKSAETPEQVLQAHYDESTGTFDQRLIDRARPHTRHAARKHGLGPLNRREVDEITVATFHEGLKHGERVGAIMKGDA